MATRRITALTLTEADLDAIKQVAPDPHVAGRVVVADVEEGDIARLQDQGVIVQSIERAETIEAGALAPPPTPMFARVFADVLRSPAPDLGETSAAAPAATDV